jgi:PP-loop superfamily ATP-utilizing enzyme
MTSEYFPNEEGKRRLDALMQRIKQDGKGEAYDCMVGVSGGLDSSYVVYLGIQYGLRMLCVHIDDGLNTEIAVQNIYALCKSANAELLIIRPNMDQYRDITRSFFLAGVPNLAMAQDNILFKALQDIAKQYKQKYSLSGRNFSMESILQRGDEPINACDKKHVLGIQKRFGRIKPTEIRFMSLIERYIGTRYFQRVKTVCPLNYIDYRMDTALTDLHEFCGYLYCGGKHYESVLTRFLQCYYLPTHFDFDKRKSHFSSLIVTNQMTRDEALLRLTEPTYTSDLMREEDFHTLATFIDMTDNEFAEVLDRPKHRHTDYPVSLLNSLAPIARKFRKYLG